ncbi:unnamed protein product [Gongylonema pulchrum]|uniref:F5/8 type C domain-containing protein n=1 Tax=Gongylonema pulchrum TaxID=637853 RepID=A0A183D7Q8_9BILA|nr:unnamed protein product [Gongylonema pulchrum]
MITATGGTSVRIPWSTVEQLPSVTIVRVLWLANPNVFTSRHTLDGQWRVVDEVYGAAVKSMPVKSSESNVNSEKLQLPGRSADFDGFYVSFRVDESVDQVSLDLSIKA